jgi:hypothetical protein
VVAGSRRAPSPAAAWDHPGPGPDPRDHHGHCSAVMAYFKKNKKNILILK